MLVPVPLKTYYLSSELVRPGGRMRLHSNNGRVPRFGVGAGATYVCCMGKGIHFRTGSVIMYW